MNVVKFFALTIALALLVVSTSTAAPISDGCSGVGGYDPACDVDHDGDIDIFDIQLTAGHWEQTGTYSIYPAMVPKTGQTTCYNASGTVISCAGTGQDGDWQKGVAWPTPRFTDNSNGTVTDNLTGLIWLTDANCFGTKLWATALSTANALNSGECGLNDGSVEGDWRLPNARELQSLVDYGRFSPALPSGHPFTGVVSNIYWTSTTHAASTPTAWGVSLVAGSLSAPGKLVPNYMWPVRD